MASRVTERPLNCRSTSLQRFNFLFTGNIEIVKILVDTGAKINARDVNDHTPLHEAVRCADSTDDGNYNRSQCVEYLIDAGADINALNLDRESPLHIACRYSPSSFLKCLSSHNPDLLQTNIHGLNCLEVAIQEKNHTVVKHLIEHESIFELMRNAQVRQQYTALCSSLGRDESRGCCCLPCCKRMDRSLMPFYHFSTDPYVVDTPMRRLIKTMPNMALKVLDKCTKTIGDAKSNVHKQFYDYEFLEDQYVIHDWIKGNFLIYLNR